MTHATSNPRRRLAGGIVAYRDEERLGAAVRSLLLQDLPDGAEWTNIWVVVSPSEDRTVAIARDLALTEPLVRVVEEPQRRGKSAAIAEVFAHAQGDLLVLMNGDAVAHPGAVAALLDSVPPEPGPFATMARPVPASGRSDRLDRAVDLMWGVHHRFHELVLSNGGGTHLSDELMLIPIDHLPPMRPGIITDGAFMGQWLTSVGGALLYAPRAAVAVTVPASLREHLVQRRRIHRGHRQVASIGGIAPTTLQRWGARHPGEAIRLVLAEARERPDPLKALSALLLIESLASFMALLDAVLGRGEPPTWERIRGRPWESAVSAPREEPTA